MDNGQEYINRFWRILGNNIVYSGVLGGKIDLNKLNKSGYRLI